MFFRIRQLLLGWLVEEEADDLIFPGGVGLVAEYEIQPGVFLYDGLLMGEGVKRLASVVAAHTRIAHSAKRQVIGCNMDDGIVDATTAESEPLGEEVLRTFVLRKEIER